MPERRSSDGYLVGVADAQASSTAPASNTTSTASRRALQQTPERSCRRLATDGRAPASAVVDPLVPASRCPPAQASLDVSAKGKTVFVGRLLINTIRAERKLTSSVS